MAATSAKTADILDAEASFDMYSLMEREGEVDAASVDSDPRVVSPDVSPRPAMDKDELYMRRAHLVKLSSRDPCRQVGCCIVNACGDVVAEGFNRMPNDCTGLPWSKDKERGHENTKYAYVVHAEIDALLSGPAGNSTVYTTLFPCDACAAALCHAGVREVVFDEHYHPGSPAETAAQRCFLASGVKLRQYTCVADRKAKQKKIEDTLKKQKKEQEHEEERPFVTSPFKKPELLDE